MEVLFKKSYESFETRMVNNAVFVSKELSSESEDDDQADCYSIASTLKPFADRFDADAYNSDSSTSTTVVKFCSKKKDYDPQAYQKWLKAKIEAERIRKDKEQVRKKREEMRKKLEEENRKEQAEQKWKQWMERKKQEQEERKIREEKKRVESKSGQERFPKKWIPNEESISNFKVWLGRVNKHEEKTKYHSLAQKRKEDNLKQQRLDLAKTKYNEWLKSSKSKPKPVPMNRGIESLRGTISSIFINPKPWQGTLE